MQIQEVIDSIAGQFGKELDHVFKEQIKTNILIARAEIIRRESDKKGSISSNFINQINCLSTIEVDISECCGLNLNCNVTKSFIKIPYPIRLKNNGSSFSFVGTIDGKKSFTYINPEEIDYILSDRFAKNQIFYSYINKYIYVFNSHPKNIRIRSAFNNPYEIYSLNDCDLNNSPAGCTEILNIPEDIITGIKSLVYAEMQSTPIELQEEEIELEENGNN